MDDAKIPDASDFLRGAIDAGNRLLPRRFFVSAGLAFSALVPKLNNTFVACGRIQFAQIDTVVVDGIARFEGVLIKNLVGTQLDLERRDAAVAPQAFGKILGIAEQLAGAVGFRQARHAVNFIRQGPVLAVRVITLSVADGVACALDREFLGDAYDV